MAKLVIKPLSQSSQRNGRSCPLWVTSDRFTITAPCPLLPPKADMRRFRSRSDYYDTMTQHSSDPTDLAITECVTTIMLTEEY